MVETAAAYEQVTRQMVVNLQEDFNDYRRRMNGSLDKIDNRLSNIEKEINSRPSWVVAILVTILTSLCTGFATYIVTHAH